MPYVGPKSEPPVQKAPNTMARPVENVTKSARGSATLVQPRISVSTSAAETAVHAGVVWSAKAYARLATARMRTPRWRPSAHQGAGPSAARLARTASPLPTSAAVSRGDGSRRPDGAASMSAPTISAPCSDRWADG